MAYKLHVDIIISWHFYHEQPSYIVITLNGTDSTRKDELASSI